MKNQLPSLKEALLCVSFFAVFFGTIIIMGVTP